MQPASACIWSPRNIERHEPSGGDEVFKFGQQGLRIFRDRTPLAVARYIGTRPEEAERCTSTLLEWFGTHITLGAGDYLRVNRSSDATLVLSAASIGSTQKTTRHAVSIPPKDPFLGGCQPDDLTKQGRPHTMTGPIVIDVGLCRQSIRAISRTPLVARTAAPITEAAGS